MSELFYHLYSGINIVAGIVMSVFAILFFVLQVPKTEALHNYIVCRRLLAAVYIVYAFFCFVEYFMRDFNSLEDYRYTMYINLITLAYSVVFIYFALGTIVDAKFLRVKNLLLELIFPVVFSITLILSLIFTFDSLFESVVYYLFWLFYVVQSVRFGIKLFTHTKWMKVQMNNYFSDKESEYLDWVRNLFFIAFIVGIANNLVLLIDSYAIAFVVSTLSMSLFVVLAVKYINYVFVFNMVSDVVENYVENNTEQAPDSESYVELEGVVKQWLMKKKYLQAGITILDVATELNTNRTYLSNFINNEMGVNFNNWINSLRIEEAKRIMLDEPDLSLVIVCERVGYTDISSFSRNFSKCVNLTPTAWRKANI